MARTVPSVERLSTAAVGQQSMYNFILQEDSEFLEETVVIGYGVQRKSDLTGAGKNEYFPFPRDYKNANPNLHDVLGWATE